MLAMASVCPLMLALQLSGMGVLRAALWWLTVAAFVVLVVLPVTRLGTRINGTYVLFDEVRELEAASVAGRVVSDPKLRALQPNYVAVRREVLRLFSWGLPMGMLGGGVYVVYWLSTPLLASLLTSTERLVLAASVVVGVAGVCGLVWLGAKCEAGLKQAQAALDELPDDALVLPT